jgi:T4-like virus tail tube protein gp19
MSSPINQNPAQSTKFQLHFDRLPDMMFFCHTANLPGLSLSPVPLQTLFVELTSPGDKITYDDLEISFIVNEDYKSWQSVHDWIRGMTFPTQFEEYIQLKNQNKGFVQSNKGANISPQFSDAYLSIYTNKNNELMKIKFVDCYPTSLSGVDFNTENNADNIIYATAKFKFSYYNIIRV